MLAKRVSPPRGGVSRAISMVAIGGFSRYAVSECHSPPKLTFSCSSLITGVICGKPSSPHRANPFDRPAHEKPAQLHHTTGYWIPPEQRFLGFRRHEARNDLRRRREYLRHGVGEILIRQDRPFRHAAHVRRAQPIHH